MEKKSPAVRIYGKIRIRLFPADGDPLHPGIPIRETGAVETGSVVRYRNSGKKYHGSSVTVSGRLPIILYTPTDNQTP